ERRGCLAWLAAGATERPLLRPQQSRRGQGDVDAATQGRTQPPRSTALPPVDCACRGRGRRAGMEADYVVIGAGSAGCVVAARLSETGARVVLLEAGPRDTNPWIHIPAGVLKLLRHPVVNWNYTAEG